MRQAVRRLATLILIGSWSLPSMADRPAQLVVGDGSIEARLRLPSDLDPGRYAIHCEAYVLKDGSVPQAFCYTLGEPAPDSLITAVTKAAERSRFVPAVRHRQFSHVYAVFMVLIDTTLAEPLILAVPNNGVERKKYGLLYTAPQRVLKKPGWGIPPQNHAARRPHTYVLMQFKIDELGKVLDMKMNNLTGASARVMREYESVASQYEFLPGYHEGRPTPMSYVEPYFDVE